MVSWFGLCAWMTVLSMNISLVLCYHWVSFGTMAMINFCFEIIVYFGNTYTLVDYICTIYVWHAEIKYSDLIYQLCSFFTRSLFSSLWSLKTCSTAFLSLENNLSHKTHCLAFPILLNNCLLTWTLVKISVLLVCSGRKPVTINTSYLIFIHCCWEDIRHKI